MPLFIFIFLLLLLAWFILIEFYRRSWNSLPETPQAPHAGIRVSVVIAVRDEEKNLPFLIHSLKAQNYTHHLLEIIVIDDHSTDGTDRLLSTTPFIVQKLPEGVTGKKKAIAAGIRIATGQLIVTTDADCVAGPAWIDTIVSFYVATGAKFIAAPVRMRALRSLRGAFQTLDFIAMQGITAASVHRRVHMMCNGANIAYEKKVFEEVNGFDGIDAIPSGDDMLLMHKVFVKYPDKVRYLKNNNAIVDTAAEPSWAKFFQQRIRWASKAVHFEDKKIFYALLLTYFVNVGFVVMMVASAIQVKWFSFLLLLFVMKVVIEFPFVNAVARFFGQQRLMPVFPVLQPLHILYIVIAGWLGRFGSYEWKSRIIKNKGRTKFAKQ